MPAFAEFFDHLFLERWNIVRLAARNQAVIDNDLFIHPISASVFHIGLDRRPGSERSAAYYASIDQHPWPVTNRCDRFAFAKEMARELECFRSGAELVGIHQSARDHERVEFFRPSVVQRKIDV